MLKKTQRKISVGRHRFMFWLNGNDYEHRQLIQLCWSLQENREFAPTIRNGLRLIEDLRAGNLEVLTELFPEIANQFSNQDIRAIVYEALSNYVGGSQAPAIPDLLDMPLEV